MGIDFSKIQAKIQEEKEKESNRGGYEKTRFWKIKTGENTVRLMPPWTEGGVNAGQFWRQIEQHWGVGEGGYDEKNGWTITCAVKTADIQGDNCEICNIVESLRRSGSAVDDEQAKALRAKSRYLSNIVDLKDPVFTKDDVEEWEEGHPGMECPWAVGDTKIQVWSYPYTIFKELLDIFTDGIDITDLDSGRNLSVTREGKGKLNTSYRLRTKPTDSVFEIVGEYDKLINNLDKALPASQPDFIHRLLTGERPGQEAAALPAVPVSAAVLPSRPRAPSASAEEAVLDMERELREALK